jgi:TRAP-type C4-dicarboxylate transport system permease small subunit
MLCFCFIVLCSYLRLYTWHIFIIVINNHNLTEGIPTLTQWWGLHGQMILKAVLVVVWLLVGPAMPDKSKVMTQIKRDTLVLQVGVGCEADNLTL